MPKELTARQERFAIEYVVDFNATQAAIRAGYSESSAQAHGSNLLKNDAVKALVDEFNTRQCRKLEINAERVVDEIAKIAFANVSDIIRIEANGLASVDLSNATDDQLVALESIKTREYTEGRGENTAQVTSVEIKMRDKLKALDMLAKRTGAYRESIDVTSNGEPVNQPPADLGGMITQLLREEPDLVDAMLDKQIAASEAEQTQGISS